MHIVVDARSIHAHMGGIGRAALELVREMALQPRGHQISTIVGAGYAGELFIKNASIVPVEAAMIDERFEQLQLPSLLRELACDLYLNTTFSVPAVKTTRRQCSIIHDVVFEDRPEYVELGLRGYLSKWSRFSAVHADHILTVSDHARTRISDVYGVDRSRITRVYNGIPRHSFAPPDPRDIARVRARYGLREESILYLGTIEVKKGVPELLEAFRRLLEGGFSGDLVLAGGKSGPPLDLEGYLRRNGLSGRVKSLGFVDEADKKPLLASSSLFVYPSHYEGFGIPPLEAMALGVPCVVSDQTSLPEIVGGAALLADVRNADGFAETLRAGLEDPSFRGAARASGPARARDFSWERSAFQVLDLCECLEAA
jgi:glycosyltransferase involved in cell wall biosynthesis